MMLLLERSDSIPLGEIMPHDMHGEELKPGDEVILRCKVASLSLGEDDCNVDLETVHPCYPASFKNHFFVNSKQVEKVGVENGPDEGNSP
jgi:hypothetical protein